MKHLTYFLICLVLFCGLSLGRSQVKTPSMSEMQNVNDVKRLEDSKEYARSVYLHATVGGLRDGHYTINGSYSKTPLTWVGLMGRTNLIGYTPLPDQAFTLRLFDENGKEVRKTAYGRGFGKPLQPDPGLLKASSQNMPSDMWGRAQRVLMFEHGAGDAHLWDFCLPKAFSLERPGSYRLEVSVRLFVKDTNNTNNIFIPLVLPTIERQLKITDSEL